jgi:hypothetical protein
MECVVIGKPPNGRAQPDEAQEANRPSRSSGSGRSRSSGFERLGERFVRLCRWPRRPRGPFRSRSGRSRFALTRPCDVSAAEVDLLELQAGDELARRLQGRWKPSRGVTYSRFIAPVETFSAALPGRHRRAHLAPPATIRPPGRTWRRTLASASAERMTSCTPQRITASTMTGTSASSAAPARARRCANLRLPPGPRPGRASAGTDRARSAARRDRCPPRAPRS